MNSSAAVSRCGYVAFSRSLFVRSSATLRDATMQFDTVLQNDERPSSEYSVSFLAQLFPLVVLPSHPIALRSIHPSVRRSPRAMLCSLLPHHASAAAALATPSCWSFWSLEVFWALEPPPAAWHGHCMLSSTPERARNSRRSLVLPFPSYFQASVLSSVPSVLSLPLEDHVLTTFLPRFSFVGAISMGTRRTKRRPVREPRRLEGRVLYRTIAISPPHTPAPRSAPCCCLLCYSFPASPHKQHTRLRPRCSRWNGFSFPRFLLLTPPEICHFVPPHLIRPTPTLHSRSFCAFPYGLTFAGLCV